MDYSRDIAMNIITAVSAYEQQRRRLPSFIFIYRGGVGVGDGDLPYVRDIELAQINNALTKRYNNEPPNLVFIVVNKQINTRFWQKSLETITNPEGGNTSRTL